jgi:CheY-like chemotaxis protein
MGVEAGEGKVNPIDILLVEDNPDDIELTLRAFRRSRVKNRIHVVRDGQEALDYIYHEGGYKEKKAPTPGLILLDIRLPRVDGLEVLRRLKSDPRFKKIPIVVLTTSNRDPDIARSYELGANSYIVKPVTSDKFMETIQKIELYWVVINTLPQQEDSPL